MENLPQKQPPKVFQKVQERTSKLGLIRAFSALTLPMILKGGYPSIGQLKRTNGVVQVEKVATVLFAELSESFDGELKGEDVAEICAELTSDITLASLSLEEVYLVIKGIRSSSIYGKLNVNKVLKALKEHVEDRTNKIIFLRENERLATKEPMDVDARTSDTRAFRTASRNAKTKFDIENAKQQKK